MLLRCTELLGHDYTVLYLTVMWRICLRMDIQDIWGILCCTIIIVLYCTVLYYNYCTVLYCTVLSVLYMYCVVAY